jgi:hypothetical protein
VPISSLVVQDTSYDLDLFFLQPNGITFASRSEDPWYRATEPARVMGWVTFNGTGEVYTFPKPATPLACVSQYQYCTSAQSGSNLCTDLAGYWEATSQLNTLLGLGTDSDIGDVSITDLWDSWGSLQLGWSSAEVVGGLGSAALLSRGGLSNGIQGPLPSNQWQLEVQHWFATSLATLQASTVAKANGPDSGFEKWLVHPNTTEEYTSCQKQVSFINAY